MAGGAVRANQVNHGVSADMDKHRAFTFVPPTHPITSCNAAFSEIQMNKTTNIFLSFIFFSTCFHKLFLPLATVSLHRLHSSASPAPSPSPPTATLLQAPPPPLHWQCAVGLCTASYIVILPPQRQSHSTRVTFCDSSWHLTEEGPWWTLVWLWCEKYEASLLH